MLIWFSKAIEKASRNQQIVESLGLPIVRGPWYDASLAVGYRRHSVSSTFPVSGPHGTGIFQLKAIRQGGFTLHLVVCFIILFRTNYLVLACFAYLFYV